MCIFISGFSRGETPKREQSLLLLPFPLLSLPSRWCNLFSFTISTCSRGGYCRAVGASATTRLPRRYSRSCRVSEYFPQRCISADLHALSCCARGQLGEETFRKRWRWRTRSSRSRAWSHDCRPERVGGGSRRSGGSSCATACGRAGRPGSLALSLTH